METKVTPESQKGPGGGLREALAHGYRRLSRGRKRCRNCSFGGQENENGYVLCRMFEFQAQGRAVCDEWEADGGEER